VDKDEKLKHATDHTHASKYPRFRLVCGEVQRIQDPSAIPERFVDGIWHLIAYIK